MCQMYGSFVDTGTKKVGDIIGGGTYAKNDDGTPITTDVVLKGRNQATLEWREFARMRPNNVGWAGTTPIKLTNEFIGTWRMSFSAEDKNGNSCGAGPYDLIVIPGSGEEDTIIYISAAAALLIGGYLILKKKR